MNRSQALAVTVVGVLVTAAGVAVYQHQRQRRQLVNGFGFGRANGRSNGRAFRGLGFLPASRDKEIEAGVQEHYDRFMPIKKRVKLAQKLVALSIKDPKMGEQMRAFALSLTKNCPARDDLCEMRAIYDWVRSNIRYTGDVAQFVHEDGRIEAVDLFQAAYKTLYKMKGGDCDDHSILMASLLLLNGIPARFRITAPKGERDWGHIYVMGGTPRTNPSRWIALDTTLPGNNFNKQAPYSRYVDFVA